MQKRLLKGMLTALLSALCCVWTGSAHAVETQLVSLPRPDLNAFLLGSQENALSANGRFVAYVGYNPGVNGSFQVLLRDMQSGTTQLVSANSSGQAGDRASYAAAISADGNFVSFTSDSQDLISGTSSNTTHVYVRDLRKATTEMVSIGVDGNPVYSAPAHSDTSISGDGRFVTFEAFTEVPGDPSSTGPLTFQDEVYVRDRQSGTTRLVSVSNSGARGNHDSHLAHISSDGRFVVFDSGASNLVAGDANGANDIFVRDLQKGTTQLVSVSTFGTQSNSSLRSSFLDDADIAISADGNFVAFVSDADNLAPDVPTGGGLYVRDLQKGITQFVAQGGHPSLSTDGHFLTFRSTHALAPGGSPNGQADIYRRDLQDGTTRLVSVGLSGTQSDGDS